MKDNINPLRFNLLPLESEPYHCFELFRSARDIRPANIRDFFGLFFYKKDPVI
jgi:hypothetical protein